MSESKIAYTTETGKEPRGSVTLTQEATSPLPPPAKRIAKKTVKKHRPRVHAPAGEVTVTVDNLTLLERECQAIVDDPTNTYSRFEIRNAYEAVVR